MRVHIFFFWKTEFVSENCGYMTFEMRMFFCVHVTACKQGRVHRKLNYGSMYGSQLSPRNHKIQDTAAINTEQQLNSACLLVSMSTFLNM